MVVVVFENSLRDLASCMTHTPALSLEIARPNTSIELDMVHGASMVTRREWAFVAVIAVAFAVLYAVYGLFRHWHFYSSASDLGIFDQAVWRLSRLERPASSINGAANLFGDHFHPIIVLFVPFYWVWPGPESLIVAQAVLLAGAIVPIFAFARRRLPSGPALALCVSYGLFWGVQRAAAYEVHEIAFAPLAVACGVLAMDRRRWGWFALSIAAVMLVKEDMIPVAGAFGLYLVLTGEWRRGLALLVASVAMFATVMWILLPWLKGAEGYAYAGIYGELLRRPWLAPLALVTPPKKIVVALCWFAPFAFLPLLSPLVVLLAPLAASRLLAENAAYWGIAHHYTAPLASILAMAAADGLARLDARIRQTWRRGRLFAWAAGLSVLFATFLPGNQPHWDLFEAGHYQSTPASRSWPAIAALVPSDASVVAQAAIVPHLSRRDRIFMLEPGSPDADIVIAAPALSPWPAGHFDELAALIEDRRRNGYQTVVEREGWIVLARNPKGRLTP
jgi:uncharacterized membrane protein